MKEARQQLADAVLTASQLYRHGYDVHLGEYRHIYQLPNHFEVIKNQRSKQSKFKSCQLK